MDPTCLRSRAGQGQWWHLRCLLGCIEPSVSGETHHGTPLYYSLGIQGQRLGPSPCSVDVFCLNKACQFQDGLVRMNGCLKKKKSSHRRRTVHTERQRSKTRLYSQVISTVTGLIQDLLNVSRFSNRTIFVGPKKVQARDVTSWTWVGAAGTDSERLGSSACHYKYVEVSLKSRSTGEFPLQETCRCPLQGGGSQ